MSTRTPGEADLEELMMPVDHVSAVDAEPVAGYVERHDEAGCPLTLLFGYPAFPQACLEITAELVLTLADAGPLDVTDGIRARGKACSGPDEQLRTWVSRAVHVTDPGSLFAAKAV
ncbi:hypothetical protein [Streptomyces sp. NEAU-W12]|uniref:hypothetical protein n=1 Tax=Streptomyces sp. NEAU-W12 TaxID=2994668 RepID=UPI00224AB0EC|nr:hypothetical protein [Streptomyces sp. NEAU-W12]MCX2926357.1 hypothetical protein [Streptomyces sp. NEAU-W12]